MILSPTFWLLLFIVPLTCWYVDSNANSLREELNPSLTDIARALDRGERIDVKQYSTLLSTTETSAAILSDAIERADAHSSSVQVANAGNINRTNFDHSASDQRFTTRSLVGALRRVIFPRANSD